MEGLTYKRSRIRTKSARNAHDLRSTIDLYDSDSDLPDLLPLLQAVQTEIIPRLVQTHRSPEVSRAMPDEDDVDLMGALAIERDTDSAIARIEELQAQGATIESLYVDLLGGTARLLGEMWEDDRIPFVDVAVGLCTLHQILFRMEADRIAQEAEPSQGRALFSPVPGESHVFGALILARIFARAGWQSWSDITLEADEIVARVAETRFDLVGLSMSADRHTDSLKRLIERIRALPSDYVPLILVGGSSFARSPDLFEAVGADATADSALEAIEAARSHMRLRGQRA